MNKKAMIDFVAEATGLKKKDSKIVIDAVLDAIREGLKTEGKVPIVGFGTFELYQRKARKGRNPKTQEELQIPAKTALKFRVSKNLKELAEGVDLDALAEAKEAEEAEE